MLKIQVSHEVSRLGKQCMADAFERLLPIIERRLRPRPGERSSACEIPPEATDRTRRDRA
jgi:hypothetical protein